MSGSAERIDVSVAICTWNRAALLAQTLEVMTHLVVPSGLSWELIVVNNNCSDTTDEVIASYAGRLPIRRVFEPTPGHSHARNAAIRELRGELLIWTDDDVLVEPQWITEHVSASRAYPGAAFFAGTVDPWFEVQPPAWFARHFSELTGVVVCVDHGPEPRRLELGDSFFGANMSVRSAIAREFQFNVRLGRVGNVLTGGDDTDFAIRLVDAGHHGMWIPQARVRHFVPSERVGPDYVKRWFRDAGRTQVRRQRPQGPEIGGVPRWLLREFVEEQAKAIFWTPARNARWFRSYRRALMLRGMIQELRLPPAADLATRS
jgi:glucosyl-dolichyl phosphate glucuronosyltransferase